QSSQAYAPPLVQVQHPSGQLWVIPCRWCSSCFMIRSHRKKGASAAEVGKTINALSRKRGATNAIDDRERVARQGIAAPSDMPIRPHQHQRTVIERAYFRLHDGDRFQRNGTRASGFAKSPTFWRIDAQAQQNETAAEEIEDRTSIAEPGMRRPRPGPRRWHIVGSVFRHRRAIRTTHRRCLIAVTQPDLVGVEQRSRAHDGLPQLLAAVFAGFALLTNARLGREHAPLHHPGGRGDAQYADGLAFDVVTGKQVGPAPAFYHRLELPTEIDC